MAHMMLTNVPDHTPDDELLAFLAKYGLPTPDEVEHLTGDGTRESVILVFNEIDESTLEHFRPRIHDIFWKDRRLVVNVMRDRFS